VFEAIERERGTGTLERLLPRLPDRLHALASLERLRSSGPLETFVLDEGEELLLTVDATLGDGSGRVLEVAAVDMFSRLLSQPGSAVRGADLLGTMARLRVAFERPFLNEQLIYDLASTDTGFSLGVGVHGRPRSAKLLRPLVIGAVRVVHRFALEASAEELRIFSDIHGDRVNVAVMYRRGRDEATPDIAVPSRRPSRISRSPQGTSLSAEVERILGARIPAISEEPQPDGEPEIPEPVLEDKPSS
jgi:hypothetical protein